MSKVTELGADIFGTADSRNIGYDSRDWVHILYSLGRADEPDLFSADWVERLDFDYVLMQKGEHDRIKRTPNIELTTINLIGVWSWDD